MVANSVRWWLSQLSTWHKVVTPILQQIAHLLVCPRLSWHLMTMWMPFVSWQTLDVLTHEFENVDLWRPWRCYPKTVSFHNEQTSFRTFHKTVSLRKDFLSSKAKVICLRLTRLWHLAMIWKILTFKNTFSRQRQAATMATVSSYHVNDWFARGKMPHLLTQLSVSWKVVNSRPRNFSLVLW